MERNERENASSKAADFIELLSQDLPWDDIDRALGSKPCSEPEHGFNPDDLSLFKAFVDSLPSVAEQASCNIEAVVPVDEDADTGMNVAPNIKTSLLEEDFCCPDEISLCSQDMNLMADILDDKNPADNGSEARDRSELHADDNALNSRVEQAELQCGVGSSSNDWSRMNEITVNGKNSSLLQPGETASDSLAAEQNKVVDEIQRGKQSDMSEYGRDNYENYDHSNDDENDDDDDELPSSYEWLRDQLHTHMTQQHDEALRVNRLRVRLPPLPGDTSVGRDPISRAIHAFTTETDATKLNIKLTDALRDDNPSVSDCCNLLDDYNPYNLSPGVLVQYPFFAGTVDACCRWEGNLQDELRTVARRLRDFMMAMYARISVDEGFLTALNRQVTAHRRALALPANATKLTKLIRKRRELSGLPEFYRSLYYDWDMFMTQFYDPDHQRRDKEHFGSAGNDRWMQRWESTLVQKRPDTACRPTHNLATRSKFRATVSDQPSVVSDVVGISEISAVNANLIATRPQSETGELAPVLSAQTAGTEMSAAEDATMVMNRRSGRLRSAASVDSDVKPVLDETFEHILRSGRMRLTVEESRHMQSANADNKPVCHSSLVVKDCRLRRRKRNVCEASAEAEDAEPCDIFMAKKQRGRSRKCVSVSRVEGTIEPEDIKPVIGSIEKRRNRCSKQSGLSAYSKTTGATNNVEDVGAPADTNSEEPDVKPDLASLNINVASAGVDVTARLQRGRSRRRVSVSRVEPEDIKLVIGSIEKRRNSNPKQSRLSAFSKIIGASNTPVCMSFEEQDVKPDLTSLNINVASADPDMTSKLRGGRSRKSGISGEDKSIELVIGTVDQRIKCRKREQSCLGIDRCTRTKNSVEVDRETSLSGLEEQDQDVKPDLRSVEVTAGKTRRDRPKRACSGHSVMLTSSMHRLKQLPTTSAASGSTSTGEKRARGSGHQRWFQCDVCLKIFQCELDMDLHQHAAGHGHEPTANGRFRCDICTKTFVRRFNLVRHRRHYCFPSTSATATPPATTASPQSPPFRLLSPSQIKVEIEG